MVECCDDIKRCSQVTGIEIRECCDDIKQFNPVKGQ